MTMIATDLGIAAARDAGIGGYRISLKQFSITEATDFEIRPDRTELVGEEVYRADIVSVENVDINTIRLSCVIQKGRPATGQWNVGEIGIWMDNGTLFAHGNMPPFPKTAEYGLKFYVYVSLARLGEVINITTSENYSLPSAASVASLLDPTESSQNVVIVLDANSHSEEIQSGMPRNSSSPALAFKYGPGGTQWGFAGHARVFVGKPDSIVSQSAFSLDVGAYGFWLSDGEVVIAQIIQGPGAGESRKMQYNALAGRFTSIDEPFSAFNDDSKLHIWRSHENALPKRPVGLPEYMVLGYGENDYSVTTQTLSATHLTPSQYAMNGNNAENQTLPPEFPLSEMESNKSLIVVMGDNVLAPSQYTVSGQVLRIIGGAPSTSRITLWGFKREATGGQLSFQEAVYSATGQREYFTPMVADTKAYLMVIANDTVVASDDYVLDGAKIVFVDGKQPTSGTVTIVVCGNTFSDDIRGSLARDTFPVAAGVSQMEFESDSVISAARNVLLFQGGKYLPRAQYRISGNKVILRSPVTNTVVDLLNFNSDNVEIVTGRTGRDTGPKWVDPAGEQGMPNKLVPRRHTHVARGQPSFAISPVPDISHLIVFVDGKVLQQGNFTYDGLNIWPNETLSGGERVEIICFTSIDHPGTASRPKATRYISTGGTDYNMHQSDNPDSRIVMVDGEFVPTSAHTYSPTTGKLTFPQPIPASKEVYLWTYEDVNETGMQVRAWNVILPVSTAKTYGLKATPRTKFDLVAAAESRILGWETFGLRTDAQFSFLEFVNTPDAALIGIDLQITHFVTRKPETRLVLREDMPGYLAGYLKSTNNLSDLTDVVAARENLGLGDAALNARYLQKGLNLADVPDKGAARDNLGITAIIQDVMNNVLLKGNNLADVPDKGAARANLGIGTAAQFNIEQFLLSSQNLADVPDKAAARRNLGISGTGGVEGDFSNVSSWWASIGPLHIRGGWFQTPNMGEGSIPTIAFRTPFPNGCLSVVLTDYNPDGRSDHDAVGQIFQAPSAASFRVFVNEPGRASSNWRGCQYIAFGW